MTTYGRSRFKSLARARKAPGEWLQFLVVLEGNAADERAHLHALRRALKLLGRSSPPLKCVEAQMMKGEDDR